MSQPPGIVLISGNSLCHNPRVLKEADALHAAGFSVRVLGAWLDPRLADRDRELMASRAWQFQAVLDFTACGASADLCRQRARVRAKLGRLAGRWLRWETPWQLGYATAELLAAARSAGADLCIAHSEQALWVAERLRRAGRRVGVDMEDWFSEDLPPAARRTRPVRLLKRLERALLCKGHHRTSTSEAMTQALVAEYGCPPPLVIYNAFPWSDRDLLDQLRKDRGTSTTPSIHWFSQTLGPGRGLEELLQALPLMRLPVEVHLRGGSGSAPRGWLDDLLPPAVRSRVFTHPLVSNGELLSRIAEHDIGYAGEVRNCRNRDITVTNKILQYLLGGLPVAASDTLGQREIARHAPGAVTLFSAGNPHLLAECLDRMACPAALAEARAAALAAARRDYHWEKCAATLVASVRQALALPA